MREGFVAKCEAAGCQWDGTRGVCGDLTFDVVFGLVVTGAVVPAPGESSGLVMSKEGYGSLTLTWDADCGGGTTYGIYRGDVVARPTSSWSYPTTAQRKEATAPTRRTPDVRRLPLHATCRGASTAAHVETVPSRSIACSAVPPKKSVRRSAVGSKSRFP